MMRGQPLAVRLAVLLSVVVIVVLLVAGIVVNRAASRSLQDTLGPREQQRLALALEVVESGLERVGPGGVDGLLRRISRQTGGAVRILDEEGSVIAEAGGRPPAGETDTIRAELGPGAGGGTLEIDVPTVQAPFLRAFNTALVLTGVTAVAALLVVAALVAARVTRPLHEVAGAARRLGAGDLRARAEGGPDAESAELAAAFNEMADRLERSETLRRRAASDLAHDLATPATVLESQLQAMVDGVVPADAAQLERARAAAASLSSVIGQLGELTQAEGASLTREPAELDIGAVAREVVAGLDGLLRGEAVGAEVTGTAPPVRVDRGQLERALRNVVTNAIQHSPAGSTVTIALGAEPGEAVVRVIDRGPGIAAEDLPFVFERFYRADRARSGGPGKQGSGIGLTVTRELLAANGGRIEVERTGPGGTTFRISLPAR